MNKILNKPKYINKSIPKFNYIKNNFNIFNKKSNNLLNNYDKFNKLNNKKYYHISTNSKNYKKEYNNPYKYNFIFGGICGIFLVDIYNEYYSEDNFLLQSYPSNFFIDVLKKPYDEYIIGFMIGGFLFPLSYSLLSASILFKLMKKLL